MDDMTFYQDHLSRNRIEYLNNLNNIIPNNTTVLIHPTEYINRCFRNFQILKSLFIL